MHDILNAANDPKVKRLVIVMGSQMGKTDALLSVMGHRLDVDPAPIIFVSASARLAESVSNNRFLPMVLATKALAAKLDRSKSRNKVSEKIIAGQRVGFTTAGSAIELASHPAALVLLDEVDRMQADVDGEGSPVSLAEARATTYSDGRIIVASTPTIAGASTIESLFLSGSQHRWSWQCPECRDWFAPEFKLLAWQGKTPQEVKKTAKLACPHCGVLLDDTRRHTMNATGKYIAHGDVESDVRSFWVSGLASPWRSFGAAAAKWIEAVRSGEPGAVQACLNTVFGETYTLEGERPKTEALLALRGNYLSGETPAGAKTITAGVDVQADRLVYAVRAWGAKGTSWLIHAGEIFGATDSAEPWAVLADIVQADFGPLKLRRMFIDSGYRPDAVYQFCRRFPGRVYPSKGHAKAAKPVAISKLEVDPRGKASRHGTELAHIDTGYFKAWIHGRIAWPTGEDGAWYLPADVSADYMKQLLAESRLVKRSGDVIWVRHSKNNHYLDAEALNAAIAEMLKLHLHKGSAHGIAETLAADSAAESPQPATPWPSNDRNARDARHRPQQGRKSNWITRW